MNQITGGISEVQLGKAVMLWIIHMNNILLVINIFALKLSFNLVTYILVRLKIYELPKGWVMLYKHHY